MVVALDDLPPLLWHTETGQRVEDVWTGDHHRGAQLNRLDDAYRVWTGKYGQQAFVRQFRPARSPGDGGRAAARSSPPTTASRSRRTTRLARRWIAGRFRQEATGEAVYCAQLMAITFRHMGLLDAKRPSNWYDPGKFWSGDRLELAGGRTSARRSPSSTDTTWLDRGGPGQTRLPPRCEGKRPPRPPPLPRAPPSGGRAL